MGGKCASTSSRGIKLRQTHRLARELFIRFEVSPLRSLDDVIRESRRWRGFVPGLSFQPVANVLLVKTRLIVPRLINVGWPETRAIRREDFINQNDPPIRELPELELRISNDDPARSRILRGQRIETQRA